MIVLLAADAAASDPYLQYGALGILFAVLIGLFWKAIPSVGRFIEKNIDALGEKINDGLKAIGVQVGEMRKDLSGIETRHADLMEKVTGRLDKIETKIDDVKTIVSQRKD